MKPIIDISYWQQGINYPVLAEQIDGVILRTAYGIWKDTMFDQHYEQFRALKVPIGCYHYIIGNLSAHEQARVFAEIVREKKYKIEDLGNGFGQVHAIPAFPLGYWNDVEDTRPGTALKPQVVLDYHNRVEELIEEQMDVYSSASKWDTIMRSSVLSSRRLWVAHYGVSIPLMPKTGGWPTWWLHQHTDRGRLPGHTGGLDMNRFNGSKAQYYEWVGQEFAGEDPEPEDVTYVIEMLGNSFVRERPGGNKIPVGDGYLAAAADSGPYHTKNMQSGWDEIEVDGIIGWISALTKWTRITVMEGEPDPGTPILTLQERVKRLEDIVFGENQE